MAHGTTRIAVSSSMRAFRAQQRPADSLSYAGREPSLSIANALEVFTGHKPTLPLLRAPPAKVHKKGKSTGECQMQRLIMVHELQSVLENMHRSVSYRSHVARKNARLRQNKRTNVTQCEHLCWSFSFSSNKKKEWT